jgi:methylmalonyl-CoA mutase
VVRPKPDRAKLRAEASARLVAWRRDHACKDALAALARVASELSRVPGALTEAAVKAAEAGATLGQISAALAPALDKGPPAHVEPLAIHPYAAAYEELRDAADQYTAKAGTRPQVFLANLGTPAECIARATYALNFFQAGGFGVANNEGFADPDAAVAAFRKSGAKIAVICSTDKKYAMVVEATTPKLKAAGARTVVLAGNPGANEAKYRAAGVDRFIFIRCDVLGTLHELLKEEGILS